MNPSLTINQIILIIGAANGLILALVLLSKRKANKRANSVLAAILTIFCINIILHTFSHAESTQLAHYHSKIIVFIFFLFGPLFYFYIKILTFKPFNFSRKDILHFLPFLLSFGFIIPFYFVTDTKNEIHFISKILSGFIIFHITFYMVWCIKLLLDHSKRIKDTFSNIDKINLRWLRFLMIGFSVIWFIAIYFDLVLGLSGNWDYVWLIVSLVLYMIGFMGLRNPQVFYEKIDYYSEELKSNKKKYEKSTLTAEMGQVYLQKLNNFMQSEKPYLKPDITLPELAQLLSMSVHHLSQVINENLNKNFFEFINSYRVEEAKTLLNDPHNNYLNISAIGFEAGFNSNSSFIAVFKSNTKLTPSQYRNSIK